MITPKILLAASAGGHLNQLLKIKDAWYDYNNIVYASSIEELRGKLEKLGKAYIVGECNREHPIKTLKVLISCIAIVLKEKPNIIISTGAAPGFLCCFWGKLLCRSKIVWVDSIANTERLSMSGRMIRPFADLTLSQWQDVASKYKNVEYVGSVI